MHRLILAIKMNTPVLEMNPALDITATAMVPSAIAPELTTLLPATMRATLSFFALRCRSALRGTEYKPPHTARSSKSMTMRINAGLWKNAINASPSGAGEICCAAKNISQVNAAMIMRAGGTVFIAGTIRLRALLKMDPAATPTENRR